MVSPRALTRLVKVDSRAMTLDGMRVSVVGEMLPLRKEIADVVCFETAPVPDYTHGLLIHD